MLVGINLSTKIAPLSLSNSYFIGPALAGISIITLHTSGGFLPIDIFLMSIALENFFYDVTLSLYIS
jgi:hypothetical protein